MAAMSFWETDIVSNTYEFLTLSYKILNMLYSEKYQAYDGYIASYSLGGSYEKVCYCGGKYIVSFM